MVWAVAITLGLGDTCWRCNKVVQSIKFRSLGRLAHLHIERFITDELGPCWVVGGSNFPGKG